MEKGQTQRKPSVDGISIVPTTSKNFIRSWLEIMRPFHHLAPREMDFAAAMLEKRYEIAQNVSDQILIDKLLFEEESKESIRETVGITRAHMQTILRKMRENGVLNGKRFNIQYVPEWEKGKPFRMV